MFVRLDVQIVEQDVVAPEVHGETAVFGEGKQRLAFVAERNKGDEK